MTVKYRPLLLLLLLLLPTLWLASWETRAADQPAAAAARPNIVLILADDLGWADLHCYGHPYAKTPHLDQLAAEGTRFLQCYATGVTCCPSRTGLMTSRFPATFATYPAEGGFSGRVTVTELLRKQGYATGHFGKWHIGPEDQPGTYGIDVIGGEEGGEGESRRKAELAGRCRDGHIYDAALRFIEQHREGPFYVNIWDHIPHHPVNPAPQLVEAFGPLQVEESKFAPEMQEKFARCREQGGDVSAHLRNWLAEIRALDEEVGRLLRRLDELGLRESTLIAFSSDQGPAPLPDLEQSRAKPARQRKEGRGAARSAAEAAAVESLRLNAMGYAGPLRGGKHSQYEGGVRIPFLLRWPGRVPAGRVDERSVISLADWLPTLCALTGTPVNVREFDGEEVSAAWLGQREHVRAKPLLWKTSAPNSTGTVRVGAWKLHLPNSRRGETELYDVVADPGEHHNLATQQPGILRDLSDRLEAWEATLPEEYDKLEGREADR